MGKIKKWDWPGIKTYYGAHPNQEMTVLVMNNKDGIWTEVGSFDYGRLFGYAYLHDTDGSPRGYALLELFGEAKNTCPFNCLAMQDIYSKKTLGYWRDVVVPGTPPAYTDPAVLLIMTPEVMRPRGTVKGAWRDPRFPHNCTSCSAPSYNGPVHVQCTSRTCRHYKP